jgi:hypothetical protein
MLETDDVIIFPQKTIFRAMVQNFGLIKMRKSEADVRNAKFKDKVIPLDNDHDNKRIIGYAENFQYNTDSKSWTADVLFEKKYLSADELQQVRTLAKRDLSIEYEYTLKKASDEDFKKTGILGDQTDILVHALSWVHDGRCAYPHCGLDTKTLLKALDSDNTILISHEVYRIDDEPMAECDHLKEIKELKEELKQRNETLKTALDSLESAEKSVKTYKEKEKDTLIENISQKTGKDAKEYKEKSLEFLTEFYAEIKDIKQDGFPPGEDIPQDPNIPSVNMNGITNLSTLYNPTTKDSKEKLFKLVEAEQ